ncbi:MULTISPECIES: hypothetical protein [Lacrimispora]|uniref:hypothetical protein n=1 Tax=Lacrimispora TaxID=2719231 RepID=UPI000BE32B90|nr:hypothetical protein [Lacrimispora amygdalina]MDK2968160.1 hypothetical protein [Lacrimispora sp.]
MKEIYVVIKKEWSNFLVRRAMIRWYLWIIIINSFIIILPRYKMIPVTNNKALLCLGFMAFSVFLIPNNLSLDLVGGEKYHRTMETFISTSVDIRKALFAKTLFIEILGLVSLVAITILDNVLLKLIFHITFLDAGFSLRWIIAMYFVIGAGILTLALLGSYVAFHVSDLKTGGYIIAIADAILVYLIMNNLKIINEEYLIITAIGIFCIVGVLSLLSIFRLNKVDVMKKIR